MDSGHHYQAALLWLLKHSDCNAVDAGCSLALVLSRQSDGKRQLENSDVVEGNIDPGLK